MKSSNALPIAVMFFLFGMISFVTGMQDPFGVIVRAQFNASNFMSQLGNAANFIAYACMGLPAGLLLRRYGYKITSLVAVGVGFVGVCITFMSGRLASFPVYLTGAFVSGFSMCLLNAIVNPMLNTLGGGGKRGNQLVQLGGACNSLNATIVPVLLGYLIGTVSRDTQIADANPALYIAMGIFAFAFVVLLFARIPEPELEARRALAEKADEHIMESLRGALKYRHFVLGAIAIFLYVGMEVSIANITNLYLTSAEVGVLPAVSGTIVGTYWFLMFCGRILGGVIGGRVSSRAMLTTMAALGVLLLVLGMCFGDQSEVLFPAFNKETLAFHLHEIPAGAMFFVLCGICTSIMWGSIFNLSVEGLGTYTGIASGIFMAMVFGGGVLPLVQSHLADLSGFIPSYIVPLIAMTYILFFAVWGSRNVSSDSKKN